MRAVAPLLAILLSAAPTRAGAEGLAVPYEMFRLPNGLTLIVHEDHSAPIASVNCWYHVGSAHAPPVARDAGEVERARSYAALGYAAEFETTQQVAGHMVEKVVYELPDGFFEQFVPRALAMHPAAIRKAAEGTIDPSRMALVVVGDRSKVEAPLRALDLGTVRTLTVEDVMGPAPKVD